MGKFGSLFQRFRVCMADDERRDTLNELRALVPLGVAQVGSLLPLRAPSRAAASSLVALLVLQCLALHLKAFQQLHLCAVLVKE